MARIDCRRCGKALHYESIKDLPHFPFCSERCKMVDLGLWFEEGHRITEDLLDEQHPTAANEESTDTPQERRKQS